jgi:elongation factor P
MRPPLSVKLKVVEAENAAKGDTVGGAKKSVTLETGVTVMAPIFVKVGETISVNPETGEYTGRE